MAKTEEEENKWASGMKIIRRKKYKIGDNKKKTQDNSRSEIREKTHVGGQKKMMLMMLMMMMMMTAARRKGKTKKN